MSAKRRTFDRVDDYVAAAEALEGSGAWPAEVRASAIATLREHGFPGRTEAWKYTRVSKLLAASFTPVVGQPREVSLPEGPWGDAPRVVFVDGLHHEGLSTASPATADLANRLGEALGEGTLDGFGALNLAFLRDGVVTRVGAEPLHIVHVSTGDERLAAVRHLVEVDPGLEPGTEATLYEHFVTVGEGAALVTAATEVFVPAGASLHHVRVLDEGTGSLHVGAVGATVADGGSYRLGSVILGSGLARVEAHVRLEAEGASAELTGLSLLRGTQHADHHVQVDHAVPHGTSDQTFRAVLDGEARSVYTGAVRVRKGAIGTDSNQLHHALLLSDDAVVNTRPWLEIDNDDVTCAHGAAIGSLDEDALFYLRQRGLTDLGARALLTWGFASESLASLPAGPVQDALQERARRWLQAAS